MEKQLQIREKGLAFGPPFASSEPLGCDDMQVGFVVHMNRAYIDSIGEWHVFSDLTNEVVDTYATIVRESERQN